MIKPTKKEEIKKQWVSMLQHMLDEYRENNPDDTRNDNELLNSLMEHFVESGLIKKKDGKFVLPKMIYDA